MNQKIKFAETCRYIAGTQLCIRFRKQGGWPGKQQKPWSTGRHTPNFKYFYCFLTTLNRIDHRCLYTLPSATSHYV